MGDNRLCRFRVGDHMKKLFLAGIAAASLCGAPALAADMAVKAPPEPVAAPAYGWTGFYIGGNVGEGWSDNRWISTGIPGFVSPGFVDAAYTASGFLGGLQGGYNYQFGWTVLGIEGDWDWGGLPGQAHVSAM
jgi:outer membrane immunogenic protein